MRRPASSCGTRSTAGIRGHPGVPPRDRALTILVRLQRLPEPLDRFDPARQVVIKGQKDGHGPGTDAPRDVQKRNRTIRAHGAVSPLLCLRLRRQIKRNGPPQRRPEDGALAHKHGARIGVRRPYHRLVENGEPWVGRKIAGPSDAGLPPLTGRAPPFAPRYPRSAPDSRDRGAGIPRRCLQPKAHRRSHRCPGSATSMYSAPSLNPRKSQHTHGVKRFQHREVGKRHGRMQHMMPLRHRLAQGSRRAGTRTQ